MEDQGLLMTSSSRTDVQIRRHYFLVSCKCLLNSLFGGQNVRVGEIFGFDPNNINTISSEAYFLT